MRGKLARELRQMTKHVASDRTWVQYEEKDVAITNVKHPKYHPDVQMFGKITILSPDCVKALYRGVKNNIRRGGGVA